ncbi:hypothetical protein SFRURICE_018595, partial [Spodoptera frugiperda]
MKSDQATTEIKIRQIETEICQLKDQQNIVCSTSKSPNLHHHNLFLELQDRCDRAKNIVIVDQTPAQKEYLRLLKEELIKRIEKDRLNHHLVKKYEDIPLHPSSLRFLYANLRSIRTPGKFDEIKCILKAISTTVHLLIFTETWITSENDAKLYQLPNYKHIFNYRKNSKGGGVSIFVHNSIKHEITEDISENGNHYLWIYIEKLSLNIGAIYKPGETNINSFLELYTSQLERRRRSIVFGDFNIDLLNKNSNVAKYRNEINETGYEILNKINKQYNTRETSTTNTILDHVCTNVKNHSFDVSIIESCLSDHKQIFLEVGSLATQSITKIRYKAIDYKKLYNSATIATYCNEENHYDYLERFISDLVNKNKINKIKIQNLPREDWINRRILNEIDQRNHMWQQTKSDPKDEKLRKNFIEQKDKVIKLIKTQKQKYYNDLFQDSYSKPKKMWEVINSLALNKTKDSSALPKLKSGSELVTEGNLVCNLFNTFFSSIGSDLANNIPNKYHMETGNILMHDHDHTHTTTLSEFTPCTIHEISKLIDDLDNNTSTGLD